MFIKKERKSIKARNMKLSEWLKKSGKVKTEMVVSVGPEGSTCSLQISNAVTVFDNALAENENLKEVWLSNSIIEIGEGAFSGCVNLESIYIPYSVEIINKDVFKMCVNLKSIKIDSDKKTFLENFDFKTIGLDDYLEAVTIEEKLNKGATLSAIYNEREAMYWQIHDKDKTV